MSVRRTYKKKKQTMSIPTLLLGLIIIGMAFVFSLKSIADPLIESDDPQSVEALSHEEFIKRLAPHAQELQEGYGILPSIVLGQAILESNWGQSSLASKYNNLFGMKSFGDEKKVNLETKEFINEEWIVIQGDFKVYNSWEDSMDDHTMLFVNGVTWNPGQYEKVLMAKNYKQAAKALQDGGYATDPTYAQKIIEVIETYNLDKYDGR
ncbi:N-acetylmuramoyl-L-alanine amidase [Enterococcus phoeniculicola]|jgi:flagellum-specific peptidoglycan hydrolase FlgJ|uniref:N-acetylmuramoyl-L-alanine amidase n=2 Tax=Enterococcus phoeniculicola TaxID=154621 RepID=R3W7W3_9ENTE|nr:glycoside hydrolase family 73 protein [Enterococcus phoeniculicola]EOL43896.1 N-acetylmuramoyl-L-alanine amidase [Enterococcus phoeniculicola ATCC BAA-412]EOT76740.1 N-acetylmuramoyl-L-alanine amidase [Enterococcus phoeniculicola ATCC BAA-412]OJG70550.1 N-acetylmuramoyl-L-alanine amidase [Enterococcus phoeniculicola]